MSFDNKQLRDAVNTIFESYDKDGNGSLDIN